MSENPTSSPPRSRSPSAIPPASSTPPTTSDELPPIASPKLEALQTPLPPRPLQLLRPQHALPSLLGSLPSPPAFDRDRSFSGAPSHATSAVPTPMSRSSSATSLGGGYMGHYGNGYEEPSADHGGLPSFMSPAITPTTTTPGTPMLRGIDRVDGEGEAVKGRLMEELPVVNCIVRARIPTTTGIEIFLHLYTNNIDTKEHLAIVYGDKIRSTSLDAPRPNETEMDRMIRGAYTGRLHPGRTSAGSPLPSTPSSTPLVRIHSECYTGETAWSARCDCGEQLDEASRLIASSSSGGVIVYLRQEGRGIGLGEKLKAYNLQDLGNDTVEANLLLRHPADKRSYGLATAMLCDLNCRDIRLLTNNPEKMVAVEGRGKEVRVRERVPMVPRAWRGMEGVKGKEVGEYLRVKIEKMGHLLPKDFGEREAERERVEERERLQQEKDRKDLERLAGEQEKR